MKANEAPEKIYCGNNGHGNLSYSNQPFPNAVEYTSTDAFIEKACSWLEDCINNGMWIANDVGSAEKGAIIESFKEYMK